MPIRRARFTRHAVLLSAGLGIVGCTLLGSRDIKQCDSDRDCEFTVVRPYCVENLCSSRSPYPDAGDETSTTTDTGTDAPPTLVCATSATCPDEHVCLDRVCTRFVKDPCGRYSGTGTEFRHAYKQPGSVVIGVYTFRPNNNGPDTAAAETAIFHVNDALAKEGDPLRISAVFCAKPVTLGDAGDAPGVLDHLSSVGIPVVVGQFEDRELVKIQQTGKRGVAVLSTLGNLPSLQEAVPDGGAVDASAAEPPYRFLVDEQRSLAPGFDAALTEAVRRAQLLGAPALPALKVRMAFSTGDEALALATRLEAEATLLQPSNADYVSNAVARVPETFIVGPNSAAVPQATVDIVAQLPNVVIALGGDEVALLIAATERQMTIEGIDQSQRPVWVVSSRAKYTYGTLSAALTPSLRKRFIGVDITGDTTKTNTMRTAVNIPHAGSFNHLYDSIFAVALAAKRARRERGEAARLTGLDFVNALDFVLQPPAGDRLTVNSPLNFKGGIGEVKDGKSIHLDGVTGPWTFPAGQTRGTRRMGTSYYCFPPAPATELLYHLAANALETSCAAAP